MRKIVKVWTNFESLIENIKSYKKPLKVFKKILIKFWKNLTKICKFTNYRFSLLAEAWTVPHSLQIFGVSGGGDVCSVPPWSRYWCERTNIPYGIPRTFFQVIPVLKKTLVLHAKTCCAMTILIDLVLLIFFCIN